MPLYYMTQQTLKKVHIDFKKVLNTVCAHYIYLYIIFINPCPTYVQQTILSAKSIQCKVVEILPTNRRGSRNCLITFIFCSAVPLPVLSRTFLSAVVFLSCLSDSSVHMQILSCAVSCISEDPYRNPLPHPLKGQNRP